MQHQHLSWIQRRLKLATHSWWPWDRYDLVVALVGAAAIYLLALIIQQVKP